MNVALNDGIHQLSFEDLSIPLSRVKNTPWTLNSLLWQVWPLDLPLIS